VGTPNSTSLKFQIADFRLQIYCPIDLRS